VSSARKNDEEEEEEGKIREREANPKPKRKSAVEGRRRLSVKQVVRRRARADFNKPIDSL
jgi:hypothetical protein